MKREVNTNTAEMFKFASADGKYVRVRWVTTGLEEKCLVKLGNFSTIELIREGDDPPTKIYPKDAGHKVKLIEVLDQ